MRSTTPASSRSKGERFDFATAFFGLMKIPTPERGISEIHRVLKSDGYFQFSITHPRFDTPHRVNLRDEKGITYAIEVGDCFQNQDSEIMEWLFSAAPGRQEKDSHCSRSHGSRGR